MQRRASGVTPPPPSPYEYHTARTSSSSSRKLVGPGVPSSPLESPTLRRHVSSSASFGTTAGPSGQRDHSLRQSRTPTPGPLQTTSGSRDIAAPQPAYPLQPPQIVLGPPSSTSARTQQETRLSENATRAVAIAALAAQRSEGSRPLASTSSLAGGRSSRDRDQDSGSSKQRVESGRTGTKAASSPKDKSHESPRRPRKSRSKEDTSAETSTSRASPSHTPVQSGSVDTEGVRRRRPVTTAPEDEPSYQSRTHQLRVDIPSSSTSLSQLPRQPSPGRDTITAVGYTSALEIPRSEAFNSESDADDDTLNEKDDGEFSPKKSKSKGKAKGKGKAKDATPEVLFTVGAAPTEKEKREKVSIACRRCRCQLISFFLFLEFIRSLTIVSLKIFCISS